MFRTYDKPQSFFRITFLLTYTVVDGSNYKPGTTAGQLSGNSFQLNHFYCLQRIHVLISKMFSTLDELVLAANKMTENEEFMNPIAHSKDESKPDEPQGPITVCSAII